MADVVVVGAGLAGLVSAIRLARAGKSVTLVTKGLGGIQLGQGTLDVLGYDIQKVAEPLVSLAAFGRAHPDHPYALLTAEDVTAGVSLLQSELPERFVGDLGRNVSLPTPVGALRPTALVQPSMQAGVVEEGKKYLFVGIKQLKDFWPELIAGNVNRAEGVSARAAWISLPARPGEVDSTPLTYARAMDDPKFRKQFAAEIQRLADPGEVIGVPGVLGLADEDAWADVQRHVGQPVFEISTIPPSVPGMRINDALTRRAKDLRVRIILGSQVLSAETEDGKVTGLTIGTAGRPTVVKGDSFVFAPGGFESGALEIDSYQRVAEPALGLPVWVPEGPLFVADHNAPQPAFFAGVKTDDKLRPVDADGNVVYQNLHVAGGILAGAQRWREKSGEGIALASAIRATDSILGVSNG